MKAGFWLSVSVAALMSTGVAHAQTAPSTTTDPAAVAAPANDAQDSDIVITAERRSTSLQRTGVAATVLTGEDLIKKSVNTVEQSAVRDPVADRQHLGPGEQLQHPRHRQVARSPVPSASASSPIATASRPSRAISRPSPITTSRRSKCCAGRRARSPAATRPAARCSSPRPTRRPTRSKGYALGAIRQLQRREAAGRDQHAAQRHLRGARRRQLRTPRHASST